MIAHDVIVLCRKAMNIRPLHPELLFFLSNIGTTVNIWTTLHPALEKAEQNYDSSATSGIVSKTSLASLYHKLASIYEQVQSSTYPAYLILIARVGYECSIKTCPKHCICWIRACSNKPVFYQHYAIAFDFTSISINEISHCRCLRN
jgi:hypothetical protein